MSRRSTSRRCQILEAGLKLFSEQGFQVTTMEQIASSVKVARTTLYEYFDSKEDILFSLLDEVISEQPPMAMGGGIKEQLTFLADTSLSRLQNNIILYRILFQELPTLSNPAAERIRDWQSKTIAPALEVIQAGIALGCFTKGLSYHEIGFAYQALLGQRMSGILLSNEKIDSRKEAEKLMRIMWYGVSSVGDQYHEK